MMHDYFRPEVLASSLLWGSLVVTVAAFLPRLLLGKEESSPLLYWFYALLPLRLILPLPAPWGGFPPSPVWSWVLTVYFLVAAGVFLFSLINTFLCYRRIIAEEEAVPESLSREFVAARRALDIRSRPVLLVTKGKFLPMLIGTVRPLVVVPGLWVDKEEKEVRCLLYHELTHFKNGDLIMGWLWTLGRALHWFNPFLRGINRKYRFYRELRCDDQVCRRLPKLEYTRTLLDFAGTPARIAGAAALAEEGGELAGRVKRLLEPVVGKNARFRYGWLFLVLALTFLPFTGSFAAPVSRELTNKISLVLPVREIKEIGETPRSQVAARLGVGLKSLSNVYLTEGNAQVNFLEPGEGISAGEVRQAILRFNPAEEDVIILSPALVVELVPRNLSQEKTAKLRARINELVKPDSGAVAEKMYRILISGEEGELEQISTAQVYAALKGEGLRNARLQIKLQYGDFVEFLEPAESRLERGVTVITRKAKYQKGNLLLIANLNAAGKVIGCFMTPLPSAPEKSDTYEEKEITFGDRFPLKGTLLLPKNAAKSTPVVIFVHGSGPLDRDESVGPNTPFRDIAHGLAKHGIASLRYDKRTYTHPATFAPGKEYGLKEEVIEDAALAAEFAVKQPGIDPAAVFILGHSLGGMMIPRIAATAPEVKGFIFMGAPARPITVLLEEQIRYLGELANMKLSQEFVSAEIEKVKSACSPAYWQDFSTYVALDDAEKMERPALILHGGRDYQVTDEDFNIWKRRVGDRANFKLIRYPELNHLMQPGEGKSSPQEYMKSVPVSSRLSDDIAGFIRQ